MKKITEYLKNFFLNFVKTRKIAWYVAAGFTLLTFITGIIASAALGFAGVTALPVVLTLLALLAFVITTILGQEKIGTALVAGASYGSFVALFVEAYRYYLNAVSSQGMTGFDLGSIQGLTTLIACVALFIVCAIATNVLAFLKQSKKIDGEKQEEIKEEVATNEAD